MPNGAVRNVPEEMKKFAGHLRKFNDLLGTESKKLKGQFKGLGETWQDQDYQKFTQEFTTLMRSIDTYLKNAEAHPRLIQSKAQAFIKARQMPT